MNLAFITDGFVWSPGGSHRVIYELSNQLSRRGHRVDIIHPISAERMDAPRRGILRDVVRRQGLWATVTAVRRQYKTAIPSWISLDSGISSRTYTTLRDVDMSGYEWAIASTWRTAYWLSSLEVGPRSRCYLVFHDESRSGHPQDLVWRSWALPLKKVFISQYSLNSAVSGGAMPPCHLMSLGIDHDIYKTLCAIMSRPLQVAAMFSEKPAKGMAFGLSALESLRSDGMHVGVSLFGHARKPKLPSYIAYWRAPTDREVAVQILNQAAVFLSPSSIEGFGLAAAEAMACGCALVAVDSGGIREFAVDGTTALLSEPGDGRGLKDNLKQVLDDPPLRYRLAENGRAAIDAYTWARSGEEFARALDLE